jgi:cAMP-dependent protein kinase regulator
MTAPAARGIPAGKDASSRIFNREQQIQMHTKEKNARKAVRGRFLDFDSEFKAPNYPKTKDDVKFLDEALGENFVFSDLTNTERDLLIKAMQKQEAQEGEIIIKQGDVGDFFYILEKGSINFVADGKDVGSCGKGGSFGELSLLYDSPRAATCVASTDAKLWKVDQGTFRHLLARTAKEQEGSIVDVLAKVPLLKDMDRGTVSKFATVLTTVKFGEGEAIVKKGEEGDIFYIINEGQVRVHDIGLGDASYADQILKHGDWFGERALMTGEPRAANVTAMTEVQAFAVDRVTFESTIGSLESILGNESKKRFIKSVPIFAKSELLGIEYDHLVSMVKEKKYKKGTKLMEAGQPGQQNLFIVKEGKLLITSADGKIFVLGGGGYFGDKAVKEKGDFISEETCVCDEDTVAWVLQRSDIESVIGDVRRLGKSLPFTPSTLNTSIALKDIKKHRILGMGTFTLSSFICVILLLNF